MNLTAKNSSTQESVAFEARRMTRIKGCFLLLHRFNPMPGDQFVALGQGVDPVPDPVFGGNASGSFVENFLGWNVRSFELLGKFADYGSE